MSLVWSALHELFTPVNSVIAFKMSNLKPEDDQ